MSEETKGVQALIFRGFTSSKDGHKKKAVKDDFCMDVITHYLGFWTNWVSSALKPNHEMIKDYAQGLWVKHTITVQSAPKYANNK